MKDIFEALLQHLQGGQPAVLLTVAAAGGSTPRGAGARMFVTPDRRMIGTIGGGRAEYLAARQADALFESKEAGEVCFGLERGGNAAMTCGGDIRVLMQYLQPDEQTIQLFCDICSCIRQRKDAWLCINLSEDRTNVLDIGGQTLGADKSAKPVILQRDGKEYYIEKISSSAALYVFGAGHVGQEVIPLMSHLGFHTILVDPRQELANAQLFPTADEVYCLPYTEIGQHLQITSQDYVVVMTNTHQSDRVVLEQVLPCHPFYLGMMGSRKKIKFLTSSLLEKGFTAEEIAHCHMPIGLDILADTPAEIAVSVAAEIIAYRAKHL